MSLLDPTSDYAVFDDLIRVSITNGVVTVYDLYGRKTGLTDRDIMAGGATVGVEDTVFRLYAETLEGLEPAPECVITDSAAVKWTVLSVSVSSYRGLPVSYRCVSRKQV